MKISIAMAVYNGIPYLPEQLASLFAQSRVPDEIVITDDGSTDGSAGCIAGFVQKYPGVIRYERNTERLGCSKNFEKAIALATGDCIFLADQDDVFYPEKIVRMAAVLEQSALPCGVFSDSRVTDCDLQPTGTTHLALRGMGEKERAVLRHGTPEAMAQIFWKRVPAAGHDMAFGAELKKYLLPFPDLPDCHDTWIGLVLAALGRWHYIDACLTDFRQHTNNASGSGARRTVFSRIQEAKKSIQSNTFLWNAKLYAALSERLDAELSPELAAELVRRQTHSKTRAAMNRTWIKRLPLIVAETVNGNYFRYARGIQSIVQDLCLR